MARHPFQQEQWGEAASRLAEVVNDEVFRSLEGKSKHALWLELADICTRHPREVAHLSVEAILRAGIRKFTDEVWRVSLMMSVPYCNTLQTPLLAFDPAGFAMHITGCSPCEYIQSGVPRFLSFSRTLHNSHNCCRWGGCGPAWRTSSSGRACLRRRGMFTRRASPP